MLEQTRITFQPMKRDIYIEESVIQKDSYNPWRVTVRGWVLSGVDIVIEHTEIKRGYMFFAGLKFKNSRRFAYFCSKMLSTFKTAFKYDITVSANDFLDLMQGYEKGLTKARKHYISFNSR